MALLATWRFTKVVTEDSIFSPIKRLFIRREKISTFLSCYRCVSFWCGLISLVIFIYLPYLNWPFAFSVSYIIYNDLISALSNYFAILSDNYNTKIVIRPGAGNPVLELVKTSEERAKQIIIDLASKFTTENKNVNN